LDVSEVWSFGGRNLNVRFLFLERFKELFCRNAGDFFNSGALQSLKTLEDSKPKILHG